MASGRAPDPNPSDSAAPRGDRVLVGGRHIDLLQRQLDRLHALPTHGNRSVGLDHLVIAHLLAFFNPSVRGLRSIEDVFELPSVRERFNAPRLPKSTVSDAQRVFDPALLLPLIESLKRRAGVESPHDARLDVLTRRLLAVDGTFFTVAPRIAWAVFNGSGKGNLRAHVQFDVLAGLPERIDLTDGQASEDRQLARALLPDCLYVLDRGFQRYALLGEIIAAKSDFVVRLRSSAAEQTLEQHPLDEQSRTAGVVSDRSVRMGWRSDRSDAPALLRCVELRVPHRVDGEQSVVLLTNRFDLPAWMIALIYRHRWQVELFFRWLKCVARFGHFFSESREGMTLQVYVTLIALLLVAIETGAKPSKYDFALISAAVQGLAPAGEALAVAAKRRAERQRAAEADRLRRARKKNA